MFMNLMSPDYADFVVNSDDISLIEEAWGEKGENGYQDSIGSAITFKTGKTVIVYDNILDLAEAVGAKYIESLIVGPPIRRTAAG